MATFASTKVRGVAQPGSVSVWGAGGRKFKSCHPDKFGKVRFNNLAFFCWQFSLINLIPVGLSP